MAVLFPLDVRAMISNVNWPPPSVMRVGISNVVTSGGKVYAQLRGALLNEELIPGNRDRARPADLRMGMPVTRASCFSDEFRPWRRAGRGVARFPHPPVYFGSLRIRPRRPRRQSWPGVFDADRTAQGLVSGELT